MTLDEIAIKYGTDKATRHPVGAHGYAPHYERFFSQFRDEPIKLLEIGVGGGESVRTWLEYFPNARIFGLDIVQNTNPWNTVNSGADPRYTFIQGDQTSKVMWACFLADAGKEWDVIIDDGSHCSDGVITSFDCLFPEIKKDRLYCIEDLGVAYGNGSIFLKPDFQNHMEMCKQLVDGMNMLENNHVESVYFANELAIIRKK